MSALISPQRPVSLATHTPSPLQPLGAEVTVTLADGTRVPYANLDYAASAPCVRAAAEAATALIPFYASVHRGAGALSQHCTREYEQARQTIKEFLGGRADDHVIFTRNTTDALNLLARALPVETTVITFAGEHHANLLPWSRSVRLPAPPSPEAAVASLAAALATRSGENVLVAVTGASNVTGELWPVAELAATAHRSGARIVLDAAQLAPHHPVDIATLDLDYVALSGHKLYAPFGVGVLIGRPDWLDTATPYLFGGGATALVGDHPGDIRWATGPARHEAGTPNVIGAVALAAVCARLAEADRTALIAAEGELVTRLRRGIAGLDRVRELHAFAADQPRVGIVAFTVAGFDSSEVAARLAAEHGIGVRDGLFCAHPFTRRLLREAGAAEPTAVRASLGLGSTVEHVDRLVEALAELTR